MTTSQQHNIYTASPTTVTHNRRKACAWSSSVCSERVATPPRTFRSTARQLCRTLHLALLLSEERSAKTRPPGPFLTLLYRAVCGGSAGNRVFPLHLSFQRNAGSDCILSEREHVPARNRLEMLFRASIPAASKDGGEDVVSACSCVFEDRHERIGSRSGWTPAERSI